ncbi:MAG TPA: hypothetical protein VJ377_03875 [Dehalococcoidales bacterium]|nr:MAG: hypothetical protein A2Z05_07875 [Chloroflexi bacterium RBG_16_60_22]HJX12648.1 hypothetical protein [Dehalococcoidales bacterium]
MKNKALYLYLALACFVGIILIFIFDGYIGLYDTLVMDNGQYPQKVEADQWSPERYGYLANTGVERGGRVDFTYTVENHRFSEYGETVSVTLWHNQDKLSDILTQTVTVKTFDKAEVKWSLDAESLVPPGYPSDINYNVSVVITRGDIERRALLSINPSPFVPKPVPAVPPR